MCMFLLPFIFLLCLALGALRSQMEGRESHRLRRILTLKCCSLCLGLCRAQ